MPVGRSILIVEDDDAVANTLRAELEQEGYVCRRAATGGEALASLCTDPPDLILLDRGLPELTGDEVLRRLRRDERGSGIPVIMLTGKAEESDALVGFALGADDYIAKPFSRKLLLARVAAQLRRRPPPVGALAGDPPVTVRIERGQPRAYVDRTPVRLAAIEHRILAALMAARGTVVSRRQLARLVYGGEGREDTSELEERVESLRRKLGPGAAAIHVLATGDYAYCAGSEGYSQA